MTNQGKDNKNRKCKKEIVTYFLPSSLYFPPFVFLSLHCLWCPPCPPWPHHQPPSFLHLLGRLGVSQWWTLVFTVPVCSLTLVSVDTKLYCHHCTLPSLDFGCCWTWLLLDLAIIGLGHCWTLLLLDLAVIGIGHCWTFVVVGPCCCWTLLLFACCLICNPWTQG